MPSMLSMPSKMLPRVIVLVVSSLDTVRTVKDSRPLISRFFPYIRSCRNNPKKGQMPSMPSRFGKLRASRRRQRKGRYTRRDMAPQRLTHPGGR